MTYFNNRNSFLNVMNYERPQYIQCITTENVNTEELEEMECSFGFSQDNNEVEDNILVKEIKKELIFTMTLSHFKSTLQKIVE